MRARFLCALAAVCVLNAAVAQAEETPTNLPPVSLPPAPSYHSEIYVPVGLALYSGPERLVVGLGGGLGYRYLLSEVSSLFAEARLGWFTGLIGTVTVGGSIGLHVRAWNPQLGLALLLFFGDGVRVLSSQAPEVPPPVAFAPALRIAPLRFVSGRYFASALTVDLGCGLAGRNCSLALSGTLLETGLRF